MKHVHAVIGKSYRETPVLICENRNSAIKIACAMHECDATNANEYVKTLVYLEEGPTKIDIADIDTVVSIVTKTLESYRTIE